MRGIISSALLASIVVFFGLVLVTDASPLRGSSHQVSTSEGIFYRRQLMGQRHDDDDDDHNDDDDNDDNFDNDDFTVVVTREPTPSPTVRVTSRPTPSPSVRVTSRPTSSPTVRATSRPTLSPTVRVTEGTLVTDPPVEPTTTEEAEVPNETETSDNENVRSLRPFSIRVEGVLDDESTFRRDLELFLLTSMKATIPSLLNIILEPAELSFRQRDRSLQQATALGYEGDAIVFVEDPEDPNLPTSSEVREVQINTLLRRSEGSLQAYLNDFSSQPVELLQLHIAGFQPVNLEGSVASSQAEVQDDSTNKALLIGIPAAIAILLCCAGGCIIWQHFIKPPPPPPYDPDDIDENHESFDSIGGMKKSAMTSAGTPSSTDSEGIVTSSEKSSSPGAIDLRKPAKNTHGIQLANEEQHPPEDDSTFGGISGGRTIHSNEEDSMAGYSLATDGTDPETAQNAPDKKRSLIESVIKERAAARAAQTSAGVQTTAYARWLSPQAKLQKQRSGASSKGSGSGYFAGSSASRSSRIEREHDSVFAGDDDEIEVVSTHSSMFRGFGGSVMSSMSRRSQGRGDAPPDDISDVPSDERSYNRASEQDLNGFAKARTLQNDLDGITGTRSLESRSTVAPPNSSWEDNPEMMEAWRRERRRIKEQARTKREDQI
jgi:hypothetical protein